MSESAYSLNQPSVYFVSIEKEKMIGFDTCSGYYLWRELRLKEYLDRGYQECQLPGFTVLSKPKLGPLNYC